MPGGAARACSRRSGGFDEVNLAVAFNDVDFCLRAREHGYLIVWTPDALLTHYESESRGFDLNPREIDYMIDGGASSSSETRTTART